MNILDLYKKVNTFCQQFNDIYLYGNGNYGKYMRHFLKRSNKKISGVIVTNNFGDDSLLDAQMMLTKLSKHEGVIFCLSEKNLQSTLYDKYKKITNCLFLKDWELNEIGKYEYYNRIGYTKTTLFWNIASQYMLKYFEEIRKFFISDKSIDEWHYIPKLYKPYCNDIVKFIVENSKYQHRQGKQTIVELGCGLGDIIGDRRLKNYNRVAYDIDKRVIIEARKHNKNVQFNFGSFSCVKGYDIKYLLVMNFTHAMSKDDLKNSLCTLLDENRVYCMIADEVSGDYLHNHSYSVLLSDYILKEKLIGIYPSDGGVREVKAFFVKRKGSNVLFFRKND